MAVPTTGETFSKLIESIRMAQEQSAMMAHLTNAQDSRELAKAWLTVSEKLRHMQDSLIRLAQGKLQ